MCVFYTEVFQLSQQSSLQATASGKVCDNTSEKNVFYSHKYMDDAHSYLFLMYRLSLHLV